MRLLLAYDGDEAGIRATLKLMTMDWLAVSRELFLLDVESGFVEDERGLEGSDDGLAAIDPGRSRVV